MFNNRRQQYKKALEYIFNLPEGLIVLKNWQNEYVYTSSLTSDALHTGHHLGQKELVLGLLQALRDARQLDELQLEPEESEVQNGRNAFGESINR